MSDDESGILGGLPRSRPGRRSDKRGGGGPAQDPPSEGSTDPAGRGTEPTETERRAARAKSTATTKRAPGGRAAAASSGTTAKRGGAGVKRAGGAKAGGARAGASAKASGGARPGGASRTSAGAASGRAGAARAARPVTPPQVPPAGAQAPAGQPESGDGSQLPAPVRVAGQVAQAGLKVAGGILKRLPRP